MTGVKVRNQSWTNGLCTKKRIISIESNHNGGFWTPTVNQSSSFSWSTPHQSHGFPSRSDSGSRPEYLYAAFKILAPAKIFFSSTERILINRVNHIKMSSKSTGAGNCGALWGSTISPARNSNHLTSEPIPDASTTCEGVWRSLSGFWGPFPVLEVRKNFANCQRIWGEVPPQKKWKGMRSSLSLKDSFI